MVQINEAQTIRVVIMLIRHNTPGLDVRGYTHVVTEEKG
jgi:hypothetical protein